MSVSDPSTTINYLMAELAQLKAKVDFLESQLHSTAQAAPSLKAAASTTRRTVLRRLAGGMLAGLGMVGAVATLPSSAEARIISSASGKIGSIVMLGGTSAPVAYTGTPAFGLMATNLNMLNPNLFTADAGVVGIGTTNGVYGKGYIGLNGLGTNFGVYGESPVYGMYGVGNSYGVYGLSNGAGIYGYSPKGLGVNAKSDTGAPFRIEASATPTDGTRAKGDMYVDSTNGNLHIWNGTEWRLVTTTAG